MTAVILFGILIIALLCDIPIAHSLLLAVLCSIAIDGSSAFYQMVTQRMFVATDSFSTAAVPFFILAGNLMERGGISQRLVNFCRLILGKMPARSAAITVGGSAFFGAISGSNAATVAAMGGVMIPKMIESGYPADDASAVAASAGTLGVVIPPSVPMIVYAITTSASVSALFLGGVIPGLLIAFVLILVNIIRCRGYEPKVHEKITGKVIWNVFKDAIWALLMPIIILGGIYGGICTPTEAAAVSCAYSLFVSMEVYKELKPKQLPEIFTKSAVTTAAILIVVAASSPFQWYMTSTGIAQTVSNAVLTTFDSRIIILLLINIILLFLGCFLETSAIILLIAPVTLPIIKALGLDPVWYGIIMVVNTSIGMITPPMALNMFVASGISKASISDISKKIIPYLLAEIGVLLLITYIPNIVMWLPYASGYTG